MSESSTSSEYSDPSKVIDSALASIPVEDESLHALILIRDRQDNHSPPVSMRVFGITEISNMLKSMPNQVHYLMLAKENQKILIKSSYVERLGFFNVHAGQTSKHAKDFSVDLLEKLSNEIPPGLLKALKEELDA